MTDGPGNAAPDRSGEHTRPGRLAGRRADPEGRRSASNPPRDPASAAAGTSRAPRSAPPPASGPSPTSESTAEQRPYRVVFTRAGRGQRATTTDVADADEAHRMAHRIAEAGGRAQVQYTSPTGESQTLATYP